MLTTKTESFTNDHGRGAAGVLLRLLGYASLTVGLGFAGAEAASAGPCKQSARLARKACFFDAKDDLFETRAICKHTSDADDRAECNEDADDDFEENNEECEAVYESRTDFCADSGEVRYDPDFSKSMFTSTFDNLNPLWPLEPGNQWVLESEEETVVINVLDATKRIGKVDCIVVNDVVSEGDGPVIEDTDDWYAQAKNGDVYYCGEESKDFEFFKGDEPQLPELVSTDGSFKHGVEGAKAGLLISAAPVVGDLYRQEFGLGDAEDGAEVLSTTYNYGDGGGLDRLVPKGLADLMCAGGDCVVTREFNLLEPDSKPAKKYYSPGVGLFLEVEGNEIVELVSCNVDPRCDSL